MPPTAQQANTSRCRALKLLPVEVRFETVETVRFPETANARILKAEAHGGRTDKAQSGAAASPGSERLDWTFPQHSFLLARLEASHDLSRRPVFGLAKLRANS
jgi:hypothetical protein